MSLEKLRYDIQNVRAYIHTHVHVHVHVCVHKSLLLSLLLHSALLCILIDSTVTTVTLRECMVHIFVICIIGATD